MKAAVQPVFKACGACRACDCLCAPAHCVFLYGRFRLKGISLQTHFYKDSGCFPLRIYFTLSFNYWDYLNVSKGIVQGCLNKANCCGILQDKDLNFQEC